ncbi:hypothetical protein [Halorussus litoreus]|uniref:hypothetical protein n=1 Tax=Halorussus litoreus TaxID=1710536 RepID=UPI000E285B36|nr:hypothetical protein [Halorussus litoreus]
MERILNEHTGTVHKSRRGTTSDEAVCGALRHVPHRQVTSVPNEETGVEEGVERCGRCFEEAGGY